MLLVKVFTGLLDEFRNTVCSVCVLLKVEKDEMGNMILLAGGIRNGEYFALKILELKDLKDGVSTVKVVSEIMPLPPEYHEYTEQILKYYKEEEHHEKVSLHG